MPLKVLERHESKDGPKCLLSLVDEVFDSDPLVQVSPIKHKNTFVSEGTPLLVIESARRLFTLRSPIEGLIKGFNRGLFEMVDQFDFSQWVISLEEMTMEKYQDWKKLNTEAKKIPKKIDVGIDLPAFHADAMFVNEPRIRFEVGQRNVADDIFNDRLEQLRQQQQAENELNQRQNILRQNDRLQRILRDAPPVVPNENGMWAEPFIAGRADGRIAVRPAGVEPVRVPRAPARRPRNNGPQPRPPGFRGIR
jgi:glycine cleavage system H lipoate-binding protein